LLVCPYGFAYAMKYGIWLDAAGFV